MAQVLRVHVAFAEDLILVPICCLTTITLVQRLLYKESLPQQTKKDGSPGKGTYCQAY